MYRHLFTSAYPVALHKSRVECQSVGCGYVTKTHRTRLPVQALLTCRQIHDEGQLVIHQDNSWALQTAACLVDPHSAILLHNEHLFDWSKRHQSTIHIRSLDFSIHLAPFVVRKLCDEEIQSYEHVPHSWVRRYFPGDVGVFQEADECARAAWILHHLVLFQRDKFPQLQSIMISLSFHGQAPNGKCGLQLKIQARLHPRQGREYPVGAHDLGALEPRRRFLIPLATLKNLQSVVVRTQGAEPVGSGTENGTSALQKPKEQPVWTFTSIREMLDAAGTNFENFSRA